MSEDISQGSGAPSAAPAESAAAAPDNADRRGRQRFVARRRGEPCFWVARDGERTALNDLSLEGFSASFPLPPPAEFDFVLHRDGVPDEIRGRAVVVNQVPGEYGLSMGCRFVALPADEAARLQEWLVAHVIMSASVRITEKDAARIVLGRSLV